MHRKKKAFILLLVAILAVVVVGSVGVTYAWFLSKYTSQYNILLNSESNVVIEYENDLVFASGTQSTPANVLTPATAKHTIGIEQEDLAPFDMFDAPTKVAASANIVKYTASGAYWTGERTDVGEFSPALHVYLSDFLTGSELSTHLGTFTTETEITAANFAAVLAEESEEAADPLLARKDLVARGEIGYFIIFDYLNQKFLYYNGKFYIKGQAAGATCTLPSVAVGGEASLRYWHELTAESTVSYLGASVNISDANGEHLLLQPNTTFSFTLYVFVARTEEEFDAEINGKQVTLFASMMIE